MAQPLTWSPEAIEDLAAIASYIERDSPWYAKVVATKVVETAKEIPDFPDLGRMVPEVGDKNIRERFVYSYRLIYLLSPDQILIVAVLHGSRLLQPFTQRLAGKGK